MSTFGTFDAAEFGWKGWTATVLTGNLLNNTDRLKTIRGREASLIETNANAVVIEAKPNSTWTPDNQNIWLAVIGLNPDLQSQPTTAVAVRFYTASGLFHSDSVTVFDAAQLIDIKAAIFEAPAAAITKIEIEFTTQAFTSVYVGGIFFGSGVQLDVDSDMVFGINDTSRPQFSYAGDAFSPAVSYRRRINSYPLRHIDEAAYMEKLRRIPEKAGSSLPVCMAITGAYDVEKALFGFITNQSDAQHYGGFYDLDIEITQII